MKISKLSVPVALLAFASFVLSGRAQVTWLAQDFDGLSTGSFTSDTSIGSGTGLLNIKASSTGQASVVAVGGSNQALAFTDNSGGTTPIAYSSMSGMSTTATGNNSLTGSFDFRVIDTGGTIGTLQFAVNKGSVTSTSGADTSVQIHLVNGLNVQVVTSAGTSGTLATLAYATDYRLSLAVDYSSGSQDGYSFAITNLGSGSIVYSSGAINTRAANVTAGTILFNGSFNSGGTNANPFIQIDNINFTARTVSSIPEPANLAAIAAAAGLLRVAAEGRNRQKKRRI